MPASEKSHNEQVQRIMDNKSRAPEKKADLDGVEIFYRNGKLIVRLEDAPSTKVDGPIHKEAGK